MRHLRVSLTVKLRNYILLTLHLPVINDGNYKVLTGSFWDRNKFHTFKAKFGVFATYLRLFCVLALILLTKHAE